MNANTNQKPNTPSNPTPTVHVAQASPPAGSRGVPPHVPSQSTNNSHQSRPSPQSHSSPPNLQSPVSGSESTSHTQLIHSELAAILLSLLPSGGNPSTAVDQALTPGGYPAFFRQHADTLPAAIQKFLAKPERVFVEDNGPKFRTCPPFKLVRSLHLDELTQEEQDQIAQWLSKNTYDSVLARLPYPPPIGLLLRTSESSLRRLWNRHDNLRRIRISSDEAKFLNTAKTSDEEFNHAAQQLLRVRTLETAMKPDSKTSELRDLFLILDRIRARDQAERKLAKADQQTEPAQ